MWTARIRCGPRNPLIGNGNFATQYRWHQQLLALGWTHTISPNLINDVRFGFNRDNAHSDPNGLTVGTSQAESAIGLTGIPPGRTTPACPRFSSSSAACERSGPERGGRSFRFRKLTTSLTT